MTIIPENPNDDDMAERRITERMEKIGDRTEDSARRIAAAIAGALDGFIGALEEYDVGNEAKRALQQAGEITRGVTEEGRAQMDTPEMKQLGDQMRTAGHYVSEHTGNVAHAASDKMHAATGKVRESATDAKIAMHDAVESAKYTAYRAKEEVRVRAEAVAETGRRARAAPGIVGHEVGEAIGSWKRALVKSLVLGALIGVIGLAAFVVLTMALIAGLTVLVGFVAALFLVTLLYVIAAAICYGVMRSAKTAAALEREERMENVREEMRHVVRPVRQAFGRGRTNI